MNDPAINVLALARPAIVNRSAYLAASPDRTLIRLHANESPWSLEDVSLTERPTNDNQRELNRYPDPQPAQLLAQMSRFYGVPESQVLPVRGSDDGIDLLIRAFCEAGTDSITVSNPTFSMYASFAEIQGARVVDVPLLQQAGFSLDTDGIAAVSPASKLVFVCTPNNPTGHSVSVSEIQGLCRELAGQSIVVVDEAYIEFSPHESVASTLADIDNLVVLRTLSKAFGAAGIRCGAVLACPDIVLLLRSINTPYALPTPTIDLAIEALSENGLKAMDWRARYLAEQARQLHDSLHAHPTVLNVFASDSNFLLVKFSNAGAVCNALRNAGVLVRDFSNATGAAGCLRISAGYEDENHKVLQILDRLSQVS